MTNDQQDLPPLSGTAKQVAWAQTIRDEAVAKLGDRLQDPAVRAVLAEHVEAGWWIDHRGNPAREVRRLAGPTERDRAEGRERTQRLLAWVLDGPPGPSQIVHDPRWNNRQGMRPPDPIYLNGQAGRAFSAWGALVGDYLGVLDRAALRAWATEHSWHRRCRAADRRARRRGHTHRPPHPVGQSSGGVGGSREAA
ncbi:hypothetical protein [Nocardia sp. NRRL S-836]|uniref:hypothetical protein n=1 Tax=Nocardia sp. NRRL S-836 TaxID=1519492 RepID=UPI0012F80C53|nr:hypothetical protein [Nocardia sp. NRRL S-836]